MIMKRKVTAVVRMLAAFVLAIWLLPLGACAQGTGASGQEAPDLLSQAKEQLAAVFANVDSGKADEIFSFFKDKIQEGSLKSEEGILSAIEEGKEKFGMELDKADAQKLVETMEKLEKIGFSAEYVLDKAQGLYQQYGAEFADHLDEAITDAVKDAAQGVVKGFFANLKSSVKSFWGSLLS